MTCDELLKIARQERPHVQYVPNFARTAIAAKHEGRFVCVACLCLGGAWRSVEHELLVDGRPVWPADQWDTTA